MKMANCRMKIDSKTEKKTVVTSMMVISHVRHPSPNSRMSILQKCIDNARMAPINTSMTRTKVDMPFAMVESDSNVRPFNLRPLLCCCSSVVASNEPNAENAPRVL